MSKSSYTLNSVRETKEKSLDALLAVVLPGGICLLSYRYCLLSKLHRSRVPPSQQPFLGWKYNYHPFLITYLARVICCCCNLLAGLQSAVQLQLPSSARLWQIWRVDSPCRLPWHPLNTGALVHPFAKICKLQVMLTLGSLHSLLSRGTQLGCWNSYVPGKKILKDDFMAFSELVEPLHFTPWTRAGRAMQQSSLLIASVFPPVIIVLFAKPNEELAGWNTRGAKQVLPFARTYCYMPIAIIILICPWAALRSAFKIHISLKLLHRVFTSSMCMERIQQLWSASQIHLLKQCVYGVFCKWTIK